MTDFHMPSLGADMESGTVVEWLVKPGSPVKKGDVIAVVETHKGAIEVECFEEGTVSELCVEEGEEVPVGALLARLNGAGEAAAQPETAEKVEEKVPAPRKAPAAEPSKPEKAPPGKAPAAKAPPPAEPARAIQEEAPERKAVAEARVAVTPAARRRAAERGLDPATLKGTGIDGSVTLADVEAAAPSAAPLRRRRRKRQSLPCRSARRGGASIRTRCARPSPPP
jgi:pyruvate dehydrogenase E2 component (dihydrolipoamide acetyltransferase)